MIKKFEVVAQVSGKTNNFDPDKITADNKDLLHRL